MSVMKRILVGRPIATVDQEHQRISKSIALAVFSSDAISSTAYATQEILLVFALGGATLANGRNQLIGIAIAVALLLSIVATSYRQTIFAYPSGGGSYVVSRENLGPKWSMVAGASLLVDYILTVAVSICAGVRAITSMAEGTEDYKVQMCLGLIALITLANLRGLKESGAIFAIPTYIYIFTLTGLVIYGALRVGGAFGGIKQIDFSTVKHVNKKEIAELTENMGTIGLLLLLKGFASGAVALTGVEAISNGVPAFRKPESKNAATTLVWMAAILGTLFFAVSYLAVHLHPLPTEHGESVFSQMGRQVFGEGPLYVLLQVSTAAILVLAANTAYADFPRLSSIIAKDGYLPRQLANRGDRLVFSNGVFLLAIAAGFLVWFFDGSESALIPLYAVGVFTSFTLSQVGMVRHHLKEREPNWRRSIVVNAVGAAATFVVLLIVGVTKFFSGAWASILVVAVVVLLFSSVQRHYTKVARALRVEPGLPPQRMNHTVVVLVGRVHTGVLSALAYAKSLHPNHLAAVCVVSEEAEQRKIEEDWERFGIDIPLEILHSPYRELNRPIMEYLDELDERWDDDTITVVLPEFVVKHFWEHILHNQSALLLKARLLFRKGTVVTSVPYHV